MKILVLDGNQRSALAATRSLGKAGHNVIVADETHKTLAGTSQFAIAEQNYPSPHQQPRAFIAWMEAFAQSGQADAALPMTEVTTDLLARHRVRWPDIKMTLAPIALIDALSNKIDLVCRASKLQVLVPRSRQVADPTELEDAISDIGVPAVVKPYRSRVWNDGHAISTSVRYVHSAEQARSLIAGDLNGVPCLYQELVSGPANGVFALYDHGQPIAFFAHRRLREKPPTGGVSVLSESCAPDPVLLEMTKRLLGDVQWHGVAMVEFKGGYLMEVNARFWGSLQLAIDAGVDFPAMAMNVAQGSAVPQVSKYATGKRLRWLLGDLDRLYLALKQPASFTHKAGEVLRFIRPDPMRTRHEVFRWNDPWPAYTEARTYMQDVFRGKKSRP